MDAQTQAQLKQLLDTIGKILNAEVNPAISKL